MFKERIAATELLELGRCAAIGFIPHDDEPTLMALYQIDDRVVAWVLAFPGGNAILVESATDRPVMTTLVNVERRWTRMLRAELRPVATRVELPQAA